MLNTLMLFCWLAIAYAVIRYRVRVTINLEIGERPPARRAAPEPIAPDAESSTKRDLVSALVNLKMPRKVAGPIADAAIAEGGDFDTMLRRALAIASENLQSKLKTAGAAA
jgi:hypothetical protein